MEVHRAVASTSSPHTAHVSRTGPWIPWTRILEIGEVAAEAVGLKGEYLSDCAMDFVVSITSASTGREDLSEETLKEKARRFALNRALSLRRHKQRFTSLDAMSEDGATPTTPEPISQEPGPAELLQSADFLRRLLAPLGNFSPAQQHLFVERILRFQRLVDLAEKTGRSPNALAQSIANIIRRLRDMLEENGIDLDEINERLNQLDRRNGT